MVGTVRGLASRVKWGLVGVAGRQIGMRRPPFDEELNARLFRTFDYTRMAALAAALRRLDDEDVPGHLAEVGVYRGDTAVVLQEVSPRRELHLFDTFAGFPQDQLDNAGRDDRFRDTSADAVRARLPADARVRMHIGQVPDTLENVTDERFALVSLDLDLSAPTLAALQFFWPRMARGAYLFVHDYHNPESDWAAKRVLGEFLTDKDEQLIDLPDIWGSVVLRRRAGGEVPRAANSAREVSTSTARFGRSLR